MATKVAHEKMRLHAFAKPIVPHFQNILCVFTLLNDERFFPFRADYDTFGTCSSGAVRKSGTKRRKNKMMKIEKHDE